MRTQEVIVRGEVVDGKDEEKKEKEFDEWELQSAADSLARAEEIKADAKLMAALGPYLEKKVASFKSLDQLRKLSVKKQAQGK